MTANTTASLGHDGGSVVHAYSALTQSPKITRFLQIKVSRKTVNAVALTM